VTNELAWTERKGFGLNPAWRDVLLCSSTSYVPLFSSPATLVSMIVNRFVESILEIESQGANNFFSHTQLHVKTDVYTSTISISTLSCIGLTDTSCMFISYGTPYAC
jgi:hypothetical protein